MHFKLFLTTTIIIIMIIIIIIIIIAIIIIINNRNHKLQNDCEICRPMCNEIIIIIKTIVSRHMQFLQIVHTKRYLFNYLFKIGIITTWLIIRSFITYVNPQIMSYINDTRQLTFGESLIIVHCLH